MKDLSKTTWKRALIAIIAMGGFSLYAFHRWLNYQIDTQGVESPDKMMDLLDQLQWFIGAAMVTLVLVSGALLYWYYKVRKSADTQKKPEDEA